MNEPALSAEDTRTLIDYARRKFAEERWPMSPALRPMRAVMEKLDPKPEPQPLSETGKARRAELAVSEETEAGEIVPIRA
jgi:hypothetical protein